MTYRDIERCACCNRLGRSWLYMAEVTEKDLEESYKFKKYIGKKICFLCRLELKKNERDRK